MAPRKIKYAGTVAVTLLTSEPTLGDVFITVQACNNSLLSLTNRKLELKGDIAVKRRRTKKFVNTLRQWRVELVW